MTGIVEGADPGQRQTEARWAWLLFAAYRFDRYKDGQGTEGTAEVPRWCTDAARILAIASGEYLTRDLVNTPAADMGPAELEAAARPCAASSAPAFPW